MIIIESLSRFNIPTVHLKKSINFYTTLLDFELLKETNSEALVSFDNVTFCLTSSGTPVKNPLFSFILDVDDFTDAISQIENKLIKIISGPNKINKGESITISDPSGNGIELFYRE